MTEFRFHALPDLGVVSLSGRDALAFLQSQLTADVHRLAPGAALPAAWCTPQGRVTAFLWLIRRDDGALAVLPRELAPALAAGLARFVMRAKVTIQDESTVLAVAGLAGEEPAALEAAPAVRDELLLARLPAGRALLVGTPGALATYGEPLAAGSATEWRARGIRQGEAEVTAATSGEWIPQMLNLDLIGAVCFNKGCYPGQEIVARAHHLGRVKRRMARFHAAGPVLPTPGQPLYAGPNKVAEVVSSSAGNPAELLAVVNLEALGLGLSDESGAVTCSPQALPYAVAERES
jgi:tRNA-modifying protein YgfZ